MKKIYLIATLTVCTLSLHSCGVMFGGSRYAGAITVKDHPETEIYVDGNKFGTGNANGLFSRNRPLSVEVKENGCEPKTQTFDKSFRTGNFILSVISWGIIGMGVDLGTGAAYKPAHDSNPNIQKISDKNYKFTVDYSECKKP